MLWYLGYVVLLVENLDPLIEFYAKKVGFPVRLRAEGYAEFAVEGAKLALLARSRMTEVLGKIKPLRRLPTRTSPPSHCSWTTWTGPSENCQAAASLPRLPRRSALGQRSVYFRDPEGHLIEIATNLARPNA